MCLNLLDQAVMLLFGSTENAKVLSSLPLALSEEPCCKLSDGRATMKIK